MRIDASALSDVGRSRRFNEDFFGVDNERRLYLVADGMGGHGHGEIASRLVVQSVRDAMPAGEAGARQLQGAIERANREVLAAVERDRSLEGMGTTLVALQLHGDSAIVAHVGDSRAYRLRDRQLKLLTSDHTWVNEQINAGNISESQALTHPFKSVITRALGGDTNVQVDTTEVELEPGDVYLLCSDGLTGMVPEERIRELLGRREPPDETCRALVQDANEAGGRDNITVVLLAVEAD